ncbi:MAG: amidohydrolase [Desulfamplus sp.]|nr:amidohydrolase [Desulfamplus sp.]
MRYQIPDIILFNAEIHPHDQYNKTRSTAVAICGRRIAAVGDDVDILSMAGPDTVKINLTGRQVLPGFIDSHFHFYEWAMNYDSIDFASTKTFGEMEDAVAARAKSFEPGKWITGYGFNESDWPEKRMPHRRDLDRVAPDNPVCIWRCDLHLAVANSRALALAGIDKNTRNGNTRYILDGTIEMEADGTPTGLLRELAPNLIRRAIPPLSEAELLKNMERAIAHAQSLGLTSIHDIRLMGGGEGAAALGVWQTLHSRDKLGIRCHVTLPGEMTDQAVALGLRTGFGDDLLRIGHLKFFADGGMGARTAWMTRKYLDAQYGMPLTPLEEIEAAVTKADDAGLSCMVHAVGDRACHEIISMFTRIESAGKKLVAQGASISHGGQRIRHRIEHLQMVLPEDLKALGYLKNIAVSCQPNNMSLDISMIDQCVGDRGRYAYALKSILATGVPVIFSSDAPVAAPNPFEGIYSAVTRKRMNGTPEQGWYGNQAITVHEALQGYTLIPALVSAMGRDLGSILPGKLADMVVIDRNIFTCPRESIKDISVDMTIFNGKIVYNRP